MIVKTVVSSFLATNTYIVGCPLTKKGLVIDPNGKPGQILQAAGEHDLDIEWIVNTHGHIDHIRRNLEIQRATGARIAVGSQDSRLLTKPRWYMLPLAGRLRLSPPPDRLLEDNDTLQVGTMDFQVLHTPGHTDGSICLKHKKAIFCGDLIFAGSFGRSDDLKTLFTSIKDRIFVLSDDIKLYPGHGPKTSIEAERLSNPFFRMKPEQLEEVLFSKRHRRRLTEKREQGSN